MQKRIIAILLILALTLSFSGCVDSGEKSPYDSLKTLEDVLNYQQEIIPITYEYVTSEEAGAENTIDPKLLKKAEKMPTVSTDQLPKWRGTSLAYDTIVSSEGRGFSEKEVKENALIGFNYFRVVLDYRMLTNEYSGMKYNIDVLKNIDDLIGWCIKYNIHVCLEFHVAPGYHVDDESPSTYILEDAQAYDRCVELWKTFAQRYKNVPANALSYNLLNEPDVWYFSDESYAALCNDLVEVIRAADDTKLILSDGMLSDVWVRACPSVPNKLLDSSIGQTIHLYPYNSNNLDSEVLLQTWPFDYMPSISGFVQGEGVPLTFTGNFKAGTVFDIYVSQMFCVNTNTSIVLETDSGERQSMLIDGYGESDEYDFWIDEYNNSAVSYDFRRTSEPFVSFTIENDCTSVTLFGENPLTFSVRDLMIKMPCAETKTYMKPVLYSFAGYGVNYETGAYDTTFIAFSDEWSDVPTTVTINGDGTFSCSNPNASGDWFDMESLDAYVKSWSDWSKQTGTPIMCNEFMAQSSWPKEVRQAYMKSVIDTLEKYEIPWCIYTHSYCSPISESSASWQPLPKDGSFDTVGRYFVDTPMIELYRSYFEG